MSDKSFLPELYLHARRIGTGGERFIHGTPYFVACRVLEESDDRPGLIFDPDTDDAHTRMVTLAFVIAVIEFEERNPHD